MFNQDIYSPIYLCTSCRCSGNSAFVPCHLPRHKGCVFWVFCIFSETITWTPGLFFLSFLHIPGMYTAFYHFSHLLLGTYEVDQFLDLGYLEGTHSCMVYVIHTIPWYCGMATLYHTMGFPIPQYHIPYHWYCPYHHTIPDISYHGCHRVAGVLYLKFSNISAGCNTSLLGTILYRPVLDSFLIILSHTSSLSSEINAFKKELNAGTMFLPTLPAQDNVLSTSQLEISPFYLSWYDVIKYKYLAK